MALETKDWQELYEGAREVFGPERAAIFMRAMEPGLRDDLATKADLRAEMAGVRKDLEVGLATVRAEISEFKATVESKFRGQTWTMVMVLIAAVGATRFL